ncbi:ROK family glucokinase [Micromonospora sp. M61]|uniref:ROK family glucokinase n=1 Tax=Micromonospora sp. M61 TaxID=2824890 RepID=UPI0027DC1C84|nr:ROK family glucokinase [Micromonospora sp. M61]
MDVGGTKMVAGVVDAAGRVVARRTDRTPVETADVLPAMCRLIRTVRGEHEIGAVGVGAAGFVDLHGATVLFAKHIGWAGEPVRETLAGVLGLPVVVENDANAAAWGEARHGAGQGESSLVCVTIGTGIGGGLIVDGKLFRGGHGVAAELGHLCVVPDGHRCGCGAFGCWEMYGSGGALVREGRRRGAVAAAGADALAGSAISRAGRAGDPVALDVLAWLADWIGRGLAGLAAVLDPPCFVLGGGVVAEAGDLLLEPIRTSFRRHLTGAEHRPAARVVPAALGHDAGLIGAADLARAAAARITARSVSSAPTGRRL